MWTLVDIGRDGERILRATLGRSSGEADRQAAEAVHEAALQAWLVKGSPASLGTLCPCEGLSRLIAFWARR